jgi:calnexin
MVYMKKPLSYYGLSTKFRSPFDLTGQTLVLQYELRYQSQMDCGGSYIKLFGADNFSPETLCNETRYIIMFGPDRCGSSAKVHFIFRHKDPRTGIFSEKHLKDPPAPKTDSLTHLYTLIVRPDNAFEILIDAQSVRKGTLLTDFDPTVFPPRLIDDPSDVQPSDWVDLEQIDDPDAQKPDDWDEAAREFVQDPTRLSPPDGWLSDEPRFVADPSAAKPDDWDDDIHGQWEPALVANPKCAHAPGCGPYEAPLAKNPEYKGRWQPPKIPNPDYRGPWRPRRILNPDFREDAHPHNFQPLVGAGFELWMVSSDVGYGNVYIGTDEPAVHRWNGAHFVPKMRNQEEEQRKLQETPGPSPSPSGGKSDFGTSLREFAGILARAWTNLYRENRAATLAVSIGIVVVPIALSCLVCRTCASKVKPGKQPSEKQPVQEGQRERSTAREQSQGNARRPNQTGPDKRATKKKR